MPFTGRMLHKFRKSSWGPVKMHRRARWGPKSISYGYSNRKHIHVRATRKACSAVPAHKPGQTDHGTPSRFTAGYLLQGGKVTGVCPFVCLSVCEQENGTKRKVLEQFSRNIVGPRTTVMERIS